MDWLMRPCWEASGPRFNGLHCRLFAFEELRDVPETC